MNFSSLPTKSSFSWEKCPNGDKLDNRSTPLLRRHLLIQVLSPLVFVAFPSSPLELLVLRTQFAQQETLREVTFQCCISDP